MALLVVCFFLGRVGGGTIILSQCNVLFYGLLRFLFLILLHLDSQPLCSVNQKSLYSWQKKKKEKDLKKKKPTTQNKIPLRLNMFWDEGL